jgi:hypothetical protein
LLLLLLLLLLLERAVEGVGDLAPLEASRDPSLAQLMLGPTNNGWPVLVMPLRHGLHSELSTNDFHVTTAVVFVAQLKGDSSHRLGRIGSQQSPTTELRRL